jgi:hypothetical protein
MHPYAAGDPPQGNPLPVEFEDAPVAFQTAGTPLLAPFGPVVRREPLRGGLTLRGFGRKGLGLLADRHGLGGLQDMTMMPVDRPHQRLPQVHQQVLPVGHLNGLGRALVGALDGLIAPVPAGDLDSRVCLQP